jgi:hypothetical protein
MGGSNSGTLTRPAASASGAGVSGISQANNNNSSSRSQVNSSNHTSSQVVATGGRGGTRVTSSNGGVAGPAVAPYVPAAGRSSAPNPTRATVSPSRTDTDVPPELPPPRRATVSGGGESELPPPRRATVSGGGERQSAAKADAEPDEYARLFARKLQAGVITQAEHDAILGAHMESKRVSPDRLGELS